MFISILVSKYLNFCPKAIELSWTVHHTFLERGQPEMTKNLHYVLFSCHSQKPIFYTAGHGLLYVKIYSFKLKFREKTYNSGRI